MSKQPTNIPNEIDPNLIIDLKVRAVDADLILRALDELPRKVVNRVCNDIQQQCQAAITANYSKNDESKVASPKEATAKPKPTPRTTSKQNSK